MTDFSAGAAWMRGQVMPIEQAHIGVLDWGLTHSDVTYDVVPVWRGGFFRLEDYLYIIYIHNFFPVIRGVL